MTDRMDVDAATSQISSTNDATDKVQDVQGGGSTVEVMDTGEEGQGWQEVRGRRVEKRSQGGSTGASPAKPDAQRRAVVVEASQAGGSIALQQGSKDEAAGTAGDEREGGAEVAGEGQQAPTVAARPKASSRARKVGGSIVSAASTSDASTTNDKTQDDRSVDGDSEHGRVSTTASSTGRLGERLEKATVSDGPAQVRKLCSSNKGSVETLCAGHASEGLADPGGGVTLSLSEWLFTYACRVILSRMFVCMSQLQQARANLRASYAAQVRPSTQLVEAAAGAHQVAAQLAGRQEEQVGRAPLALPGPAGAPQDEKSRAHKRLQMDSIRIEHATSTKPDLQILI